ncbi:MAG TPA: efflux RND transporter periplasmic adaptor subunit [Gemmatimonadales bacterium]|jgi:RND family efflux transporter MFP subunit|nr:efflux RND transporter periplasmic adaptor subunit [Gemmatimonadales bacterium]
MRVQILVIGLSAAAAVAGCRGAAGEPAPPAVAASAATPVRVAPVTAEAIAPPIMATGTLGPKEEIALGFKIGGVISRISVDAGATVRPGQVLATLDPREIDAAVTRAGSAAEKAERDLARARRLYTDSVFTLSQFQDAETGATMAQADLTTARFNRRYAAIVAPAAGVILARHAEPGELVASGATILVLGSRTRGSVVRAGLADRDVVRIARGDSAMVRFDALPGKALAGRVTEIAAAAEPGTGAYPVEIALPAAGAGRLASGMVAQVEIRPASGRRTLLVPIEALLEADGQTGTVYALSADRTRAERRSVTIAFLDRGRAAIAHGLEGIALVITDGAAYVRDGAKVRVLP